MISSEIVIEVSISGRCGKKASQHRLPITHVSRAGEPVQIYDYSTEEIVTIIPVSNIPPIPTLDQRHLHRYHLRL